MRHSAGPYISANSQRNSKTFWIMNPGPTRENLMKKISWHCIFKLPSKLVYFMFILDKSVFRFRI
jgi:hypothetical protein